MGLRSRSSDSPPAMSKDYAKTIEPKIRTSRYDVARSRCKGSNRLAQLSTFCLFMPLSTIPSTPSATSHPGTPSASLEARHSPLGEPQRRHEPDPCRRVLASGLRFL